MLNSYGVTSAQEAGTLALPYATLRELEKAGALTARVVASMPVRPFIEEGVTGVELIEKVRSDPGELVRPEFVKVFLDGVPMTRTTAFGAVPVLPWAAAHHW